MNHIAKNTVAELRAVPWADLLAADLITTQAAVSESDGGGCESWVISLNDTRPDNTGIVVRPNDAPSNACLKREHSTNEVHVAWFGGPFDGVTANDTALREEIGRAHV